MPPSPTTSRAGARSARAGQITSFQKGRKPRRFTPQDMARKMVENGGNHREMIWEIMVFRICFNRWICGEMWKLPIIRETLNCFSNNHWISRENWNSPIVRQTSFSALVVHHRVLKLLHQRSQTSTDSGSLDPFGKVLIR